MTRHRRQHTNTQDIVDNTSSIPGETVSDSASVLSTVETQKHIFVYNGNTETRFCLQWKLTNTENASPSKRSPPFIDRGPYFRLILAYNVSAFILSVINTFVETS